MDFVMKLLPLFSVLLLLLCSRKPVSSSNILFIPLIGEGSHLRVMTAITKEMKNRGHSATFLVASYHKLAIVQGQESNQVEAFTPVVSKKCLNEYLFNMTQSGLRGRSLEFIADFLQSDYYNKLIKECRSILADQDLMSRLKTSNYSLVVTDTSVLCPLVQFLKGHSSVPFVGLSPLAIEMGTANLLTRSPFNPSYMPEFISGYDHVMSFKERFLNTAMFMLYTAAISMSDNPFDDIKHDFEIPGSSHIIRDAELLLINTHFALDFPRPFLPNRKPVGGLTSKPSQPLNREWLEYLDSAGEDGVVLFSMGSYATGIDEDVAALFAGAFAQIPQKVIWKLNGKPSATLSPNVKVVDWVPQNDLLGHPKIKVFVYHCGMNGVWEAVYHGVPMVAVPLFGDQYDNARRLVSRGMAVKVDIATLTSDELANAIQTVANNPSYKKNATRISALFRDSPRTPTETAADWLEYVIRHGGAKHLRSAALDLNIFQYLLLDVIAVLLLGFVTFFVILFCSCKLCFKGCKSLCCGGSTKAKRD